MPHLQCFFVLLLVIITGKIIALPAYSRLMAIPYPKDNQTVKN